MFSYTVNNDHHPEEGPQTMTEQEAFAKAFAARRAEQAAHDVHRQKADAERQAEKTLCRVLNNEGDAEAAYRVVFAARQEKAAAFDAWHVAYGKRTEAEERLDVILGKGDSR